MAPRLMVVLSTLAGPGEIERRGIPSGGRPVPPGRCRLCHLHPWASPVPPARSPQAPGGKTNPLTGSSWPTPGLNLRLFKSIIKAHSPNYKIIFHLSEGGGLAGA